MTNAATNGTLNHRTLLASPRKYLKRSRWPKADRVLYWSAAMTPWWLAILLLGVSMPHLAHGFMNICHCGALAGWLLAVAIDTAQVVAKLQLTMAKRHAITTAATWTATGIVAGTSIMSMALNVLAFLSGATTHTGTILAVVTGVMLPLLILALSYTGSAFALAKRRHEPRTKGRARK